MSEEVCLLSMHQSGSSLHGGVLVKAPIAMANPLLICGDSSIPRLALHHLQEP